MKLSFTIGFVFTFVSFSVLAKKIDCHQLDGSSIGGTYYEAEITGRNVLSNFKIIDVTGGKSTLMSLNNGPFKGILNSNARDPQWKNYIKYANVSNGDCRYNQCITLVLPENLWSQLGHNFGGYVSLKDDHASSFVNLNCQVY